MTDIETTPDREVMESQSPTPGSDPLSNPSSSAHVGRRGLLSALGLASGAVLAGCLDGNEPDYEDRETVDVDGEERTAEEMATAERLAEQEIREGVTPLADVSLVDHEFVLEDGYEGSTIQGTVENAGDDRLELVAVRTRVYDDAGDQLDRYLDRTGDLAAGERWAFTVIVLESPAEVAGYDIAALATPS